MLGGILFVFLLVCSAFGTNMKVADKSNEMNFTQLMQKCNETYQISDSYLEDLNKTGSFHDESDETPMCYLHCIFDSAKMIDHSGRFDVDLTKSVIGADPHHADVPDLEDIVDACISQRDETDMCRKAYGFVKCIMTQEIMRHGASATTETPKVPK